MAEAGISKLEAARRPARHRDRPVVPRRRRPIRLHACVRRLEGADERLPRLERRRLRSRHRQAHWEERAEVHVWNGQLPEARRQGPRRISCVSPRHEYGDHRTGRTPIPPVGAERSRSRLKAFDNWIDLVGADELGIEDIIDPDPARREANRKIRVSSNRCPASKECSSRLSTTNSSSRTSTE